MTTATLEAPALTLPACYSCKATLCTVCGLCETDACLLQGRAITTKGGMIGLGHLMAQTQKARGYSVLAGTGLNVPKPYTLLADAQDITQAIRDMSAVIPKPGIFARPCPVRPRHGFVDSRTLKGATPEDLQAHLETIFTEARSADPEAEILLVPLVKAAYNVILTPTRMAIGRGNDGATAGRKSKTFPLLGVPFSELPDATVAKCGVDTAQEDPYVEAVLTSAVVDAYRESPKPTVFFTQVRAGVRIPPAVGPDFIPDRMQVDKTVEASGDLLEWERQVKEDIKPGTVVYHLGGSLISHYGVHCIFHNIPILTSRKPEIGEELLPTSRPSMPDPKAVARGLCLGAGPFIALSGKGIAPPQSFPLKITCSQAVAMLLVISHNAAALGGDDGYWIGIAASLMLRLGQAASHGEARHKGESAGLTREYIYRLALNDFFGARDTIGHAQWRFKNLRWSSSYGGPKWAACTDSVLRMEKDARNLLNNPTDEAVTALVTSLHNAINQAHNGGWWLNKFVQAQVFDDACRQSMYTLSVAAVPILAIAELEVDDNALDATYIEWQTAPDPEIIEAKPLPGEEPSAVPTAPSESEVVQDGTTCGDTACPDCYPIDTDIDDEDDSEGTPIDLMAWAGKIEGKDYPPNSTVTAAQGKIGNGGIHVQIRLNTIGPSAYFSFDAAEPWTFSTQEAKTKLKLTETAPSWSGSVSMYTPLEVSPIPDKPGWWKFSCPSLGLTVERNI